MQQIILSIPEPCHQDWQQMTPTQQGRYCNACAKQVVDFSAMSDAEVLHYFSNLQNENVCGRTYPDQLERTIAMPVYPKKKLFWYWNYITMFFLFFAKSNNTKAQGGIIVESFKTKNVNTDKKLYSQINKKTPVGTKKFSLTGAVKNDNGDGIPFATVTVLNSIKGLSTDEQGKFCITLDYPDTTLNISAAGYETIQQPIQNFSEQTIVLKKSTALLTEVVITATMGMVRRHTLGGVNARIIKRSSFKDSIRSIIAGAIKIYPNPVSKGNSFNLALKLKETGTYKIQITDALGRIVLIKQINATAKLYTEQVEAKPAWSSGIYYLSISNHKNSLISTGSFSLK